MNLRSFQMEFFETLANTAENFAMQIYENSILGGKIASLRVTYAALVKLIGVVAFDCIAASYFAHHTESPIDIGQLGIAFPAYLKQHDIILQLPYISDLARLEWQRHQVFESPEPSGVISENTNGVFVEHYSYRVDLIWKCCQKNYDGDFNVDIAPHTMTILMYRSGQKVMMRKS